VQCSSDLRGLAPTSSDLKANLCNGSIVSSTARCSLGLKRSRGFDAVWHGGRVFLISGTENSMTRVETYDPLRNMWFESIPLPVTVTATALATSVRADGEPAFGLVVVGGYDMKSITRSSHCFRLCLGQSSNQSAERLNSTLDLGSLARDMPHAALKNLDTGTKSPNLDTPGRPPLRWEVLPSLGVGRSHHGAIGLPDGSVLVAGGFLQGASFPVIGSRSVELLDYCSSSAGPGCGAHWIGQPSLIRARYAPRLLLLDEVVYAIGGDMLSQSVVGQLLGAGMTCETETFPGQFLASAQALAARVADTHAPDNADDHEGLAGRQLSIERRCPLTGCWTLVAVAPVPRTSFAATMVSGWIFVFGGVCHGRNINCWDAFDCKNCIWLSSLLHSTQQTDAEANMPGSHGSKKTLENCGMDKPLSLFWLRYRQNAISRGLVPLADGWSHGVAVTIPSIHTRSGPF
jgi:hypothetical protein